MHREETHSAPRLLSSAEFETRLNQVTRRPTDEARDRLVLIGFGGQDDLVSDHGTEATRAALRELGARITSVIPAGHAAAHLFSGPHRRYAATRVRHPAARRSGAR